MSNKLKNTVANLIDCNNKKCKDEFSAVMKDSFDVFKREIYPLLQEIKKTKQDLEEKRISKAEHAKFTKTTMDKINTIKTKMIESDQTLQLQLCSVKNCLEENKKNIKVLNATYNTLCKQKIKPACDVAMYTNKIKDNEKLSGQDIVNLLIKENKVPK